MKTDNPIVGNSQVPTSAAPAADKPASVPTIPGAINNIPLGLQWDGKFCYFKLEARPGTEKPAKVPYDPKTGLRAKSTDPSTFATFQDVRNYAEAGYDGIGVGIFGDIAAIDIDHCVQIGAGNEAILTEMAQDVVNIMQGSYMEYSPSGTGIRILCKMADGTAYDKAKYLINNQRLGLEIYVAGATSKYVSVTGNSWTPGAELSDQSAQLRAVMDKYMLRSTPQPTLAQPVQQPNHPPVDASGQLRAEDRSLIEAMLNSANGEKARKLLNGDMSDYDNDHSRADMALCCILARHTNDAGQIDRIVRSSGLMRPKWDAPNAGSTYGAITIAKAIAGAAEYRKQSDVGINPALLQRLLESQAATQPQTTAQTAQQAGQAAIQPEAQKAPPVAQQPGQSQALQTAPQSQSQQASQGQVAVYSAQYLQTMVFAAVQFLVQGILACGVTMIVAAPKIGKSWLAMLLAICLSEGLDFLGRATTKMGVLYLALEDGPRRLSDRLKKLTGGRPITGNCHFMTEAPTLANGALFQFLDGYLATNLDIKCIIIDTLQKVRGIPRGKNAYAQDYEDLGALKKFADDRGLSLVIIHHTNKGESDSDPYNKISGTNGIMGAVDATMVIEKKKRGDEEAYLHITGRDVEEYDWVIRLNRSNCQWEYLGTEDEMDAIKARMEYEKNPVVLTVKQLLDTSPNGQWRGNATALLTEGVKLGHVIGATPRAAGLAIHKIEDDLRERDGIIHRLIRTNGKGGGDHEFFLAQGQVDDDTVAKSNAQSQAEADARYEAEERAIVEEELNFMALAAGEEEPEW